MDLDTLWCREFNTMMNQRRAQNAGLDIKEVEVPTWDVAKDDMVFIQGTSGVDYYKLLDGTEARLFGRNALKRRKYDYKGEYIKDKEGNYVLEDVTTPNDCVAIVSDVKIKVPNSFKHEGYEYVDMVVLNGKPGYLYIIPRSVCYRLNMTALVLSLDKLRNYYSGVGLATVLGYYMYLYIIPYKPRSSALRRYRVLCTKTSIDYQEELSQIQNLWMQKGFIFPPEVCVTESGYKGRDNMAVEVLPIVRDEYVRYDPEKSMSNTEEEPDLYEEEGSESLE